MRLPIVEAESLGSTPKFQVKIEIQLNTARISRLSFHFLWLCRNRFSKSFWENQKETKYFGQFVQSSSWILCIYKYVCDGKMEY